MPQVVAEARPDDSAKQIEHEDDGSFDYGESYFAVPSPPMLSMQDQFKKEVELSQYRSG